MEERQRTEEDNTNLTCEASTQTRNDVRLPGIINNVGAAKKEAFYVFCLYGVMVHKKCQSHRYAVLFVVCGVCAHMPLVVSKYVRGLPMKYSPLYFLSKYLLVYSIDIKKMFG